MSNALSAARADVFLGISAEACVRCALCESDILLGDPFVFTRCPDNFAEEHRICVECAISIAKLPLEPGRVK